MITHTQLMIKPEDHKGRFLVAKDRPLCSSYRLWTIRGRIRTAFQQLRGRLCWCPQFVGAWSDRTSATAVRDSGSIVGLARGVPSMANPFGRIIEGNRCDGLLVVS